jgi:hypothetical protein
MKTQNIIKDKNELIKELRNASTKGGGDGGMASSAEQQNMIRELREKLADTRALLVKERNMDRNAQVSKDDGSKELLVKKLATLEKENSQLKKELSAFDIDFFEEIEDLKYAYKESQRREEELKSQIDRLKR